MRSGPSYMRRHCRRHGALVSCIAIAVVATDTRPVVPGSHAGTTRSAATDVPFVAAPFAMPPPAVRAPGIVVRVTGNGAPIEGAAVVLGDGSAATRITARTDREGIARFADLAPGPYEVWATTERQASALGRIDVTDDTDISLALEPAAVVRGELVAASGAIARAGTVELVPLDTDHAVRMATIDDSGHFAAAGVPPGRWRIDARVAGHAQVEGAVIDTRGDETTAVVRVVPTGTVTGTVVDDTGAPVANATLVLRDAAGTPLWPFEVAADTKRWIHPLAQTRYLPTQSSSRFGAGRSGSRPAECGRGHCGVDLGTERGDIVHAIADGVVVALFPENRTEAGRVVALHHGGGLRSMYMHLDELRPGLEVGHTVRAGDAVGTLGTTGIVRSAPHLHFAITQERAGRTWYIDPEPILRHAVVLPAPRSFDVFEPTATDATLDATMLAPRFVTDATGAFRIDGVAPGSYVAVAFASELAPGASASVDIRSDEVSTGVVITLRAGSIVHGRVVGPNGPIASAQVIASAGTGASTAKIASTTTDKHGEYTLRAVSGKVSVSVNAKGYSDGERTVTVDDRRGGRVRQREDFTLAIENAQLRGQLLAPDGGAAAGVYVRIVDGISRRTTVSDAQGRFDLSPVATGRYVLELSSREYPGKRVTLDSGRWADVRLERGGAADAIVRGAGDPLAGARIVARGPAGQSIERTTDARGAIALRALSPGTWTLRVRAAGYSPASRTVSIRAGEAPAQVQLDLARAATLGGVIRNRFGQRVAGATVRFGELSVISDADGNFLFASAPSGAGVLEAQRDAEQGSLPIQLAPGEERLSITLELR